MIKKLHLRHCLAFAALFIVSIFVGYFSPVNYADEALPGDLLIRIRYDYNGRCVTSNGVGAQLQNQPYDPDDDAQIFRLHYHSWDTVSLFTLDGHVVEVEDGSKRDYGRIIVGSSRSAHDASQKWEVMIKNDAVMLKNVRSKKFLNTYARDSEWMIQYHEDDTPAELFTLFACEDPIVRIQYAASGRVLDVPAERIDSNENALQLWDFADGNVNQMFRLHHAGDGMYQLTSLADGKVIEVARSLSATQCAPVQTYSPHTFQCAYWRIVDNQDGTYCLQNAADAMNLNVDKGVGQQGAKVQIYTPDGTQAEKFYILSADGTDFVYPEYLTAASEYLTAPPEPEPSISAGDQMVADMLAIAEGEVGNDGSPYWQWYGLAPGTPWCATFTSYCASMAGLVDAGALPSSPGCGTWVQFFQDRGTWYDASITPEPGMMIIYRNEYGNISHIGIVTGTDDSYVYTIEGNYSDAVTRVRTKLTSGTIVGYGKPAI